MGDSSSYAFAKIVYYFSIMPTSNMKEINIIALFPHTNARIAALAFHKISRH